MLEYNYMRAVRTAVPGFHIYALIHKKKVVEIKDWCVRNR